MVALSDATRERLTELEASGAMSAVSRELHRLLAAGEDVDCYKINAFRVAHELGVPRVEMLRGLLFATRLGLFDLNWDIRCPSCTGTPDYHRALMKLLPHAHCGLCNLDFAIDFEEQVEVTFTANPDARKIEFKD